MAGVSNRVDGMVEPKLGFGLDIKGNEEVRGARNCRLKYAGVVGTADRQGCVEWSLIRVEDTCVVNRRVRVSVI